MNLAHSLADMNWLAVAVATIVAFSVGGLWYSKALFGDAWLEEVGLTEEAVNDSNKAKTFGGAFILQLLATTALAATLGAESTLLDGLHSGLFIGILWILTSYGVTYLFEQRSMRLFFINAGYYVVLFAISGSILGAWH